MKVQEFLNQNITLSERELTPVLGIRNVKTVYNAHKHDIMFTFYDNLRGLSEKSWNLCWNEILGIFTTFYSWIPSNMENIDNIPFSFDRDSVKAISKLGISNSTSDFADGITLTNNVLKLTKNGFEVQNNDFKLTYLNKFGQQEEYKWIESSDDYSFEEGVKLLTDVISEQGFIGFLNLSNRTLFEGKVNYSIKYNLLRDTQDNYKLFDICHAKVAAIQDQSFTSRAAQKQYVAVDVYYLILKSDVSNLLSEIYYRNKQGNVYADIETNKIEPLLRPYEPVENSYILNGAILKRLSVQYGMDYPVGFTNYPCGTIKDVYKAVKFAEIPLDEDVSTWEDTQAVFQNQPVKNLRLLEFQGKQIHTDKPIFKNKAGKRLTLPEYLQINPDKIVRYLNIKATVLITNKETKPSLAEAYYGQFVNGENPDLCMIDAGYFESSVAITTDFNLSLLSVDFWKHGQAGIIDISDKIYPTQWYGKQHPFEFEFVVVDDPSTHKIFTNLELISNKVKPESFHYEVVGDTYDFAEDKPTMYFRQEALKALYQYNGYNIEYDPNFLSIEPKQHNKSADLPKYYSRWDTINNIYDSYKRFSAPLGFNYDHLAGAEIVYYPTRNEFRVWNHVEAIDVDSLNQDIATSVIKANCQYLEDKWLVSINPIIVTYKNEIDKKLVQPGTSMFSKDAFGVYKYSNWVKAHRSETLLPPINIQGTKLQEKLFGDIEMPGMPITHNEDGTYNLSQNGKDNALYGLYDLKQWDKGDWRPIDPTKNKERRETDVRGKFMKVRVRYTGDELAIIDFLNTIYQISFA